MPRPISYAVFCLKKKKKNKIEKNMIEKIKYVMSQYSIDNQSAYTLYITSPAIHIYIPILSTMIILSSKYYTPLLIFFFFNDTATTEIYTLSLHDALPISRKLA